MMRLFTQHKNRPILPAAAAVVLIAVLACTCAAAPDAVSADDDSAGPAVPWPEDALGPDGRAAVWTEFEPVYAAGAGCFAAGGDTVAVGSAMRLRSGTDGSGGLSYAVYHLEMGGHQPELITLDACCAPEHAGEGSVWVGVANYGIGAWEWLSAQPDAPGVYTLPGGDFVSGSGNLFVAAVAYDGGAVDIFEAGAHERLLAVGPGRDYPSIMDAYAAADDGEMILVYPRDGGSAYEQVAVFVDKPGIHFRAVAAIDGTRVVLSGDGFDYSGIGSTPRAIFQFQTEADGCVVTGFELRDAHNSSFNGAGVRINQANDVTIRDCEIHACDMGIMSNGNIGLDTGVNQRIELCLLHHNGNAGNPGYNHNLYLGGTSVTLSGCEVHSSLTGHNVKSRAHFNWIEYCYVHDSANREFDLVDAKTNTDIAGSHSVLLGNIIAKDPDCAGNRQVIHFGQDGGYDHNGLLYLVNNTIATPFISPVVLLSAWHAGAEIHNNIITDADSGQNNQAVVAAADLADVANAAGGNNWLAHGQIVDPAAMIDDLSNYHATAREQPPLIDALNADRDLRDYHLTLPDGNIVNVGAAWAAIGLPAAQLTAGVRGEYLHPCMLQVSPDDGAIDRGAYEWE